MTILGRLLKSNIGYERLKRPKIDPMHHYWRTKASHKTFLFSPKLLRKLKKKIEL